MFWMNSHVVLTCVNSLLLNLLLSKLTRTFRELFRKTMATIDFGHRQSSSIRWLTDSSFPFGIGFSRWQRKLVRQKLLGAEIKWQKEGRTSHFDDFLFLRIPLFYIHIYVFVCLYPVLTTTPEQTPTTYWAYYGNSFVNLIPFHTYSKEDVSSQLGCVP